MLPLHLPGRSAGERNIYRKLTQTRTNQREDLWTHKRLNESKRDSVYRIGLSRIDRLNGRFYHSDITVYPKIERYSAAFSR